MIEVFGIAFSIMGLLPSIASTLAYSIPSGKSHCWWRGCPRCYQARCDTPAHLKLDKISEAFANPLAPQALLVWYGRGFWLRCSS